MARFVPASPKPDEGRAPASGEYVLWRWEAVPTANAAGGPPVPVLQAVSVGHAYVRRGKPIGFRVRRPDGLLIAVAGPTTRPLPPGRYVWRQRPPTARPGQSSEQLDEVSHIAVAVVLVAGVVAAVLALDYAFPHGHVLDHILNGGDDDVDPCRPIDAGRPAASNRRRGR